MQPEMGIQDRVVRQRQLGLPLPGEVSEQPWLPVGPQRVEGVGRRLRLGDRVPLGELRGRLAQKREHVLGAAGERGEEGAGLKSEAVGERLPILFQDLRGEDLPGAVGQVVRLVHEQDDVLQVLADQMPHRHAGLEDVVVVRHDRVGPLGKLQLHLERTDFLAPRFLEDGIGVQVRVALPQPREDAGPRHLFGIAPGEAAELLVAEDPVVCAHLLFRANLQARERALVHRDERRDRHLLLEGLRSQEDDLLAGGQAFPHRRIENRGCLAGTRRRLGDQVLS